VRKLFILAATVGALGAFSFGGEAMAQETEAQFIERAFLRPHNSRITADMVLKMRDWYGIEPLWTLTILGAETSIADPKLGGRLVKYNNFGCIRSGSEKTKWGQLANGTIVVGGKRWWTYPDPWIGMAAWGRLIKVGPASNPGYYLQKMQMGDWAGFCRTYYGANVPGLESYTDNILYLLGRFKSRANAAGWAW
jgi:hypothetical protein